MAHLGPHGGGMGAPAPTLRVPRAPQDTSKPRSEPEPEPGVEREADAEAEAEPTWVVVPRGPEPTLRYVRLPPPVSQPAQARGPAQVRGPGRAQRAPAGPGVRRTPSSAGRQLPRGGARTAVRIVDVVVAVVVVLGAIALAALDLSSGSHSGERAGLAHPTSPAASSIAPAPGAPRLTAVVPAAGGAGDTLTVTGVGLYSPDGLVEARFDGRTAPTSCASTTACTVTVPSLGGGALTVTVSVTTQAGSSNSLAFRYTGTTP